MSRRKRRHQRQLPRHNRRPNDPRQPPRVLPRTRRVRAAHAEHLQHRSLRREDGAAADGTDFDAGHGDGDEEVLALVRPAHGESVSSEC